VQARGLALTAGCGARSGLDLQLSIGGSAGSGGSDSGLGGSTIGGNPTSTIPGGTGGTPDANTSNSTGGRGGLNGVGGATAANQPDFNFTPERDQAVAYRIDVAHTGVQLGMQITPPLRTLWSLHFDEDIPTAWPLCT